MRVGGGKKHGRYWIGDGAIDSAATPSLSQIRASSTSTSPAIRPRKDTSHHRVEALEAQLEQERRIREQMQATMERVEAEREAEQRRMVEILQYMQSLGAATGVAPPPSLFAPPPPPPPHYSTPNQSAASNDPHASANPSPNQFH
ncbi:uncharacterized protein LOC133887123 [Phragmites australis]|uniref:uncharacterized protein LOC133887123 n=1 Tax=Phragmites australis TaxID=29695 RepID=UPI002D779373|nr:uncharacterized protein LOC133887123 [Phragmites australis]